MSELVKKAAQIILDKRDCVLTLNDKDGYPSSSVLTISRADGIKELIFCTGLGCNKVQRIEISPRAAVCFASDEYSIGLSGDIEVITDPEVKKEMWYEGLENHFSGADDPNLCVLKFTAKRYNLFVDWTEEAGEI